MKYKGVVLLALIVTIINSCTNKDKLGLDKICNLEYCEYGEIINNKKEGVWKRFDKYGNLIQVTKYVNGLKNGPSVAFYADGMIYSTGYYLNDTISGNLSIYHENGFLNISSNYVKGKRVGFQYDYSEKGILSNLDFYSNDKQDKIQLIPDMKLDTAH